MASRTVETSTDYRHPYRPLPVKAFNALGRAAENLGWSNPLSVEALVDSAKRKTGLSDFGDDGHVEALNVLVRSMNEEAQLTATGSVVQRSRLDGALVQRLRIEELLRQHPEIQEINLGSITVITGLQRTGTTLLHRLLFSHPEIRGVTGFEAMEPVPAGAVNARGPAIPSTRATLAQRAIGYLSPNFNAIHPMDPGEPEEDILLLDLSLMSQTPEATMHVPTYARWLEEQDQELAYEYFAKVLRILCWRHPARHWVLKTPQHMEYLDVFLKVFPEALVVQTHRDPRKTVPSFCSMVAHGRGIFSDAVDPQEIASHWLRKTQRMVESAMETRVTANPDQFIDVSYYDLMDDPIGQLQRITERAGLAFDSEAVRNAEQYLDANPRNRFGRHSYRLDDFGLDEETIDRAFAAYRTRYAIPVE